MPDDFGDSLVFGEIRFPLWGFGWEFCDLFSQPRNLEVHIALQEGCGQLAVVLLASQSPVSQLEVPTVGSKKMAVRLRKINQKKHHQVDGSGGVFKLLVVKHIVSIFVAQLVVYRNCCLLQRRIIEFHHLPTSPAGLARHGVWWCLCGVCRVGYARFGGNLQLIGSFITPLKFKIAPEKWMVGRQAFPLWRTAYFRRRTVKLFGVLHIILSNDFANFL